MTPKPVDPENVESDEVEMAVDNAVLQPELVRAAASADETSDPVADQASEQPDLELRASALVPRLMGGALLLIIVAMIAAGVLAWMHHGHERDDSNGRQAAEVAATSLEKLLSFTPADVLVNADSESKLMTGTLEATYTHQLKSDWGPKAVQDGITTKAQVIKVARSSVSGDTVKLVVYANLTRSVAGTSQSDIITSTMLITMTKVDGIWRISEYKGV